MLKAKLVSSLEKAFVTDNIDKFEPLTSISALKGERLNFQLLHTVNSDTPSTLPQYASVKICGSLADYATARVVKSVPIETHLLEDVGPEEDYLSLNPGLFPDLLIPMPKGNTVSTRCGTLSSLWIEIDVPENIIAGERAFCVSLSLNGERCDCSINIKVIDAALPKQEICVTQWFHTDCLATYYEVDVFSERHWEIIEAFAKTAVKNGINMLLTPIHTPPLDTAVDGERLTTQLVKITKRGEEYSFDFSLLDRWIDMCNRVGIKYFEIAHLFTQWGAKHAPKIVATADGEEKRIFGWETDALSDEYRSFLRAYLSALLDHMKARGDDRRCYFHISDEPNKSQLQGYHDAKASVADILEGYPIIDAISDYEFWKEGVLDMPIPSNDHIAPFIRGGVKNLWTYYFLAPYAVVEMGGYDLPFAFFAVTLHKSADGQLQQQPRIRAARKGDEAGKNLGKLEW